MNITEDLVAMGSKTIEYAALNAHDRCDRCEAQAYVRWVKSSQDLVMCAHHTRKYELSLLADGWVIHEDNREVLTARPVAAY
jgi:hypothetical protein